MKKWKTYISCPPQNYDIKVVVDALKFKVNGDPMNRKIGDRATVNLKEGVDDFTRLEVQYYGQHLSAYFCHESLLIHAAYYCINQQNSNTIPLKDLTEVYKFMLSIFKNEFLMIQTTDVDESFVLNLGS